MLLFVYLLELNTSLCYSAFQTAPRLPGEHAGNEPAGKRGPLKVWARAGLMKAMFGEAEYMRDA